MSTANVQLAWPRRGRAGLITQGLSRRGVARATSVVPVVVGVIVLLGWAIGWVPLTTLVLWDNPVRPNTALAVLLLGIALLVSIGESRTARRVGGLLYGFVGLLAAATVLEYALGTDFGIDAALFPPGPELTMPFPARMALSTAVGLLVLSLAGLGAVVPRLNGITVPLGLVAVTLAGLMILGHLYDADEMTTGFSAGVSIAVPTAVALGFLAAGILARPGVGRFYEVLGSRSPGGSVARVLTIGSLILLPTVGLVRGLGEQAGLYGTGFGLSITVGVSAALLSCAGVLLGRRLDLADAAQRRAEQEFLRIIELTDDAMCITGPDGRFRQLSSAWARLLGYELDELRGRPFIDFVHPDDVERTKAEWTAILREGRGAHHFVNRYRHLDGTYRWIEWASKVDPDSGNAYAVARDVTARARIERERALLSAIVESTDDAVISTDLDGRIQSWNPAATRLYGYTEREAIGRPMTFLVPPELAEDVGDGPEQIRTAIRVENWETVRMARDGRRISVMITLSPLHDVHGRLIGQSAITRDITELQASRERLEAANRSLAARNTELRDFASIVSHDLRAPLRRLQMFAGMAVDTPGKDAEVSELLERIQASADRMERLVIDLLSYARLGRSTAGMQRVDLTEVVADALEEHQVALAERHAIVEVGRLPAIEGDAVLLRQLFSNLIGNAIKFASPERVPTVSITATGPRTDDRGREVVVVSVRDNGIGFDPRHADRIFRIFERLSADESGTGVGLAICRKISDLHDGAIDARSEPGSGATFEVLLPVQQATEPSHA